MSSSSRIFFSTTSICGLGRPKRVPHFVENPATNLCQSDDPESFAEASTQAPRRKNDLIGVQNEEVVEVRLGPPLLGALQIFLRRRACVNVYECRREIFVRQFVHIYFFTGRYQVPLNRVPAGTALIQPNLLIPSDTIRYFEFFGVCTVRGVEKSTGTD